MTDCVVDGNQEYGIITFNSTVNLHGETTAIHSNQFYGICAWDSSKVIIHLFHLTITQPTITEIQMKLYIIIFLVKMIIEKHMMEPLLPT